MYPRFLQFGTFVISTYGVLAQVAAGCGVALDPMDPVGVAKAVEELCRDPEQARRLGENGRRAILERYNWENEFAKLDDLYRRIV